LNFKISQLFIEFLVIFLNILQNFGLEKNFLLFKAFTFVPKLQPFGICCRSGRTTPTCISHHLSNAHGARRLDLQAQLKKATWPLHREN